jgi:type I restriction enzyme, S subunit
MKLYPSYESTHDGFWNSDIPSNWEIKRIGSVFTQRNKKVSDKDYEPLSVTKKGIFPQWENVLKSDSHDNRKLVLMNDFVINSRSDRRGSSGLSKYDGSVSLINTVLIPSKEVEPKYSEYIFKSYGFINEFYKNGRGIVDDLWSTKYSLMKNINICIPPLPEQSQIISFLDTKTKKIDTLIEKTEKKIELLKEKRTSFINHCVTKGLNPNVEMKDSGVEWIGGIPKHWNIKPLFSQCYHTKQKNDIDNKNVLSLSYGRIVKRNVETNFGLLPESFDNYQLIEKRFVILRLTDLQNDKKSLRVGFCEQTGIITPVYVSLNCYEWFDNKFLFYQLYNSDLKKVLYTLGGGLRQTLRFDELKRFPLSVCSKDEQTQIVEYLDGQTQKIDTTIEKETKRIELLKEYRQSLISEVVTGKVDVRGLILN